MEEMEENFPIILQDNIEVKFHFSWRNAETIIRVEVVSAKKSGVKSGIGNRINVQDFEEIDGWWMMDN